MRFWWNLFGPMFSAQIRKRRVVSQKFSNWAWHIEADFVAFKGAT
ncbi:MAG: putative transposase [Maricaulis maris]